MTNLKTNVNRIAGYTIDQTILIVAVIAILITMIIASVGYDLIKRAGGTKAASQIKQLEDASGLFYARYGMWPDDALTGSGATADDTNNIRVLQQNIFGATQTKRFADRFTNLLPGVEDDGAALIHGFGAGGIIGQKRVDLTAVPLSTTISSGSYMVLYFDNMPLSEAEEADEGADGSVGRDAGRVILVDNGSECASSNVVLDNPSTVRLCYIANLVR